MKGEMIWKRLQVYQTVLTLIIILSSQARAQYCQSDECQKEPTKVIRVVRGRLGNHISGYWAALAIKDQYPVEPLISDETKDTLQYYFQSVTLRSTSEATCGFKNYYKQFLDHVDLTVIRYLEQKVGKKLGIPRSEDGRLVINSSLAQVYPKSTNSLVDSDEFIETFKPSQNLLDCKEKWEIFSMRPMSELKELRWNRYFHLYPGSSHDASEMNLYKDSVLDQFLNDLTFKAKFTSKAESILMSVRDKHIKRIKSKKAKKKSFTFIGVHWRQTDHLEFEKRFGIVSLHWSYFIEAMHMFRSKFKKSFNVVFIFVSDDMEQGKAILSKKNKDSDIYFVGNGLGEDKDGIGYDMALLRACNHTILSHGTYSRHAGLFAGGIRIVPEHFKQYRSQGTEYSKWLDKDPITNPIPRNLSF